MKHLVFGMAFVFGVLYRLRVLGQWFDGIRFYAAASSPRRSRHAFPAPPAFRGDLGRASVVVLLQHPLLVVRPLELEQGPARVPTTSYFSGASIRMA